ncbi:glycosyltransferase [Sphingobium sp. WW5]|uniref:glycosyltransferase n=1 Tax=unclassified Sphingobium TaxID=2611147 RepID=UPI003C1BA359
MQTWKSWWAGLSRQIRPKSNGMPVGRRTANHIKAANAARTRQDWIRAAADYRLALASEPHLHHLWVQLGHMEKEAGAIDRARNAYEEAVRLKPQDVEPLLHLGHMAKAWQQPAEAATYFFQALQGDGRNLQAISELARVMPDHDHVDPAFWASAMAVLNIPDETIMSSGQDPAFLPDYSMMFDVTDLLAFFGQRRLPTGIQRVQIEISLALMDDEVGVWPLFCIYSSARRGWVALPSVDFQILCRLAKQSDDVSDPIWIEQLFRIYRKIAIARTIQLSSGPTLVNLGTSWSDRNYLLDVRTARARTGIIYVPLVFDLIPLIEPAWFMESLVRDYRAWFSSLLHSADGYLVISQATRRDLLDKAAERNAPISADAVPVVPLDGNFRQDAADVATLHTYGLNPQAYVLLVSTLEPRKNHIGAFHAWMQLAETMDEATLPHLVCVGGRGWLNDALHQMLRDTPHLQKMVHILHGVPDDRLAMLYEHCLFALYPSFYEGWGLPVSEALSYGKVPAISAVSSLPEAGGSFAQYFDPYDADSIATAILALLNTEIRSAAERTIRDSYAPRTWRQIAQELLTKAQMVKPRASDSLVAVSGPGTWLLSLSPQAEQDIMWGEPLRYGNDWQAPTSAGCRITGQDAALWFHWSGAPGMQLHVHVTGAQDTVCVSASMSALSCSRQEKVGGSAILSFFLPDAPGPVRVALHPSGTDIIVEKVEITGEL